MFLSVSVAFLLLHLLHFFICFICQEKKLVFINSLLRWKGNVLILSCGSREASMASYASTEASELAILTSPAIQSSLAGFGALAAVCSLLAIAWAVACRKPAGVVSSEVPSARVFELVNTRYGNRLHLSTECGRLVGNRTCRPIEFCQTCLSDGLVVE